MSGGQGDWLNPRFAVALLIVGLFAWAFGENTSDQTMVGALIGAFNLAIGYYLGSSNASHVAREQVGEALKIANAANPTPDVILKPGEIAQAQEAKEAKE